MLKLHLDTDLGGDIDDLCALAMVLGWPEVELTGVTTVAEVEGRRAGYVRYALELAGRPDIPVAAGADGALGNYRIPPSLPEESRYWPEPVAAAPTRHETALSLLEQSIEQEAVIAAIGPVTTLALLEKRSPGILKRARLFLMGGYVYPPREGFPKWDHTMDWNVQVDVQSALSVLEHSTPTLIPLSMTVETSLRRAYLPALKRAGPLARLIAGQAEAFAVEEKIEEKYGRTCAGLPGDTINFQHDPLACAIALGWKEGVEITEVPLQVEVVDGWLQEKVDPGGRPFRVVKKVDAVRFNSRWLSIVAPGNGLGG